MITKRSANKWIGLLIALAVIPGVLSFTITTFSDGSNLQNFTFYGSNNLTKYINIPTNAWMINVSMNLTGFNISIRYENGINVTTYSGYFPDETNVVNPQNADDGNIASYTQVSVGFDRIYFLNFTNTEDVRENKKLNLNAYIGVLGGTAGDFIYFYCYDYNVNDWAFVGGGAALLGYKYLSKEIRGGCYNDSNPTNIIRWNISLNTSGSHVRLYDVWIDYNGTFPYNTSLYWDGDLGWNYGSVNGSYLDHKTPVFFSAKRTWSPPSKVEFLSNTSGILQISDFKVDYNNMLNISIYDEDTEALISQNITIEISKGINTDYYWTLNGSLTLYDEYDGDYTVAAYNSNYAKRRYAITFTGGESISESIYLANRSNEVTFTVVNRVTGDEIENAIVKQYREIGGGWSLLNSLYTDINGQAKFTYAQDVRYQFTVEKDFYENRTFIMDPIQSDEYTVLMSPIGQGGQGEFYGVIYLIDPESFINNVQNNLSVTVRSAYGILAGYNVTVTYPTGTEYASGSTSTGETFILPFNITNAAINDTVKIRISYLNTYGNAYTHQYEYLIDGAGVGTMLYFKRGDYGLGILERVLLMIGLSIIVGGALAGFSGSIEGGLAAALLVQGIVGYLLNVNVLFILPSIIAGLLLISRRNA